MSYGSTPSRVRADISDAVKAPEPGSADDSTEARAAEPGHSLPFLSHKAERTAIMSRKRNLLTIGLTALGIMGFETSRADDTKPTQAQAADAPSVVLLTDGRILHGQVTQEGDDVFIKQRGGQIKKKKDQIEGLFHSLDEIYTYRKSQIPELDPDEHLKLARWCLSQKLTEAAKVEVQTVLKVSPRSAEARAMLVSLESEAARQSSAPVDSGLVRTGGEMEATDQVPPAVLKGAKRNLGIPEAP